MCIDEKKRLRGHDAARRNSLVARVCLRLSGWQMMHSVLTGLAYLHEPCTSKGRVVHQNLRTDNIMLDARGLALLGEYGVARTLTGDFYAQARC